MRACAAAAALILGVAVLAHRGGPRPALAASARPRPALTPPGSPPPAPPAASPAPSAVPAAGNGRFLPVPLFAQALNLSCEAASLQMALAYAGIRAGQAALLAAMRPDYSRPVVAGGRVVAWSDPYDHFVGDPAGHEYDHTGYGVYYPVVAGVARAYRAEVVWAGTGLTWERLRALVTAGDAVIVWVAYDGSAYGPSGPSYSYRATDGRTVVYAPGFEHTVTVSGITPGAVLVNNPRWGHRDWLTRSEFESAAAPFGGMAVALAAGAS